MHLQSASSKVVRNQILFGYFQSCRRPNEFLFGYFQGRERPIDFLFGYFQCCKRPNEFLLVIFNVAGDQINSCWLFSMLQETKYNCKKIATKKREQYLFGGDCILRIENQAGFATIFS